MNFVLFSVLFFKAEHCRELFKLESFMYAIKNMMCNQKLRFEFSFVSLRKSNDFQYSGLPVLNCIQLFDSYRPISIDLHKYLHLNIVLDNKMIG